MKKLYSKPEIIFESFTLSTNIAANCELKTALPSSTEACGYQIPRQNKVIFIDEIQCSERAISSLSLARLEPNSKNG